ARRGRACPRAGTFRERTTARERRHRPRRAARKNEAWSAYATAVEPLYSLAKGAFYPGLRWGLKWTIEGGERIPERGAAIVASNHISYLDPLTLAWLADRRGRRVRFLAKAELFD